jgi:hypothetical protein
MNAPMLSPWGINVLLCPSLPQPQLTLSRVPLSEHQLYIS